MPGGPLLIANAACVEKAGAACRGKAKTLATTRELRGMTETPGDAGACDFIEVPRKDGPPWRIARRLRAATAEGAGKPGLVWLGGFNSDMRGTKAEFLDAYAQKRGCAFLRFDYSGHGESEGRFADGAVSDWFAQSLHLFETSTQGPQILIGSSMGAWIALLIARALGQAGRAARLRALVLLAPAPDFTERLIWDELDEPARRQIMETGAWPRPSPYAPEPTPITRRLIEDGRSLLLLGDTVRSYAPTHILQGLDDADVPWRYALELQARLVSDPVDICFIPGGDHRLSRASDLERLEATLEGIG
jgi:pimeloyl-ACP methyl ester carboxylesterase